MPHYQVIIVLGAAVWQDGEPSPALRRRVAHAVRLWHAGRATYLLMTGGLGTHPPAEAEVMRQLALAADVCASRIVVEDQAASTWQSALRCADVLRQHRWSSALVVTDHYHLPRALLAFRWLGVRADGSAPVARPRPGKRWRRWYAYCREVPAYGWYVLRLALWSVRQKMRRRAAADV